MMQRFRIWVCLAALFLGGHAYAQPAPLLEQDTVFAYLDTLTQWQRDMVAVTPNADNAREIVFRDSLRDNATKVLQTGFVFLRSVAGEMPPVADSDPESTRNRLTRRVADLDARIASLRALPARSLAQQDQLRLEQARRELAGTILANLNSASSKSPNKLVYTIDSLSRSIPELQENAPKTAKPGDNGAISSEAHAVTSILSISVNLFDITRKQRELDEMIAETSSLKLHSMELMKTLRGGLGDPESGKGHESADTKEDEAPAEAVQAPLSVDQQVEAYKRIGANIVPLAETMRWIDASKQTLTEWQQVLKQQRDSMLRQFGIRFAFLLVALAIPLALSEAVRRTINHIPDGKRKRQLHIIRRALTGIAVVLILLLNFISDFSSFATFAGFLTAGLAVALQSVLLSLVAHFLFYGRYGIRNGDRVNVGGVTGDILQIGMVRFYLRELQEGKDGTLEPTGKIVAFPNSIIFQGVAFYKYV